MVTGWKTFNLDVVEGPPTHINKKWRMKYGSLDFNGFCHTLQGNHKSLVLIVLQKRTEPAKSNKQKSEKINFTLKYSHSAVPDRKKTLFIFYLQYKKADWTKLIFICRCDKCYCNTLSSSFFQFSMDINIHVCKPTGRCKQLMHTQT